MSNLTIDKLKFSGGVEIEDITNHSGYRRDITVGILKDSFNKLVVNTNSTFSLKDFNHDSNIRPGISSTIVCSTGIDGATVTIVLFNKKSHLEAAVKASKALQRHPKYLLDDTNERKELLRQELLAAGFIYNNIIKEAITGPFRAIKRFFS